MKKFTCSDCGKEINHEGLCKECSSAYSKAIESEGVGVDSTNDDEEEDE